MFVLMFFILNIVNTYWVTVQELNRYIAPFRHTFLGEINAFLGNFSILFLLMILGFLVIKRLKGRMIFLMVLTFFLNLFIFGLGVFNLFFGTAFSIPASTIFWNPADGFAMGTFLNAILELITYYRILVFLPFFALLTIYLLSNREELKTMVLKVTVKKYLSSILLVSVTLFTSIFSYYEQYKTTLPLNAVKSTFAIQNLGVYPYYVGEVIGQPFDLDLVKFLELNTEEKLADAYQDYNKNVDSYVSFFDQQTYSNRLTLSQSVDDLFIDDTLKNGDELQGLLKDKNLVLVHLESLNTFLMEEELTSSRMPFFNALIEQSFYFNNFYNNVGMGVSSDGELAVLTGLNPSGDRTLYWEYNKDAYRLDSLIAYFGDAGYYREAIHGDKEKFYNRDLIYPEMYGFDRFYSLESFVDNGYDVEMGYLYDSTDNKYHISPWISDYHLADFTANHGASLINTYGSVMLFPVTMMPHTPYEFDPNGVRYDVYPEISRLISRVTLNYINYVDYVDDILKRFFISETGVDQTLDNSVYIFYSDHGSGIKNGDLDLIFNREISVIETRQILQKVPAWIYVPGDEMVDYGTFSIRKGLLTGTQPLVRSQVDLYRTVIELFDLPVGSDPYFGVHGLSKEKTFALDNRLMDVVTDDYFYSMRNPKKIYPLDQEVDELTYHYILRYKQLSDIMISKGDMQMMIKQALENTYGS
jgi:phosphoglycerol transferase MdoB-like AlkP superfamily enzyme